jgi:hypothetical protein
MRGIYETTARMSASRPSPYTNALTLPGGKWTPHDLRRKAAAMLSV